MDYSALLIIGSFIGMLVGMWQIARSFKKDLDDAKDLLFSRFDDHKKDVDGKLFLVQNNTEEKYVRLDLCNKTSGNIEGRLKSIDAKLDSLLMKDK